MLKNINIPKYVEWQITTNCNLNCIHCSSADRHSHCDLSTQDAVALAHELVEEKIRSVTFAGGEPLLRDDWMLLAGIFKAGNVSVQIISNGQCLDEEQVEHISQLGIDFVWLSLDGPKHVHNTIRRHPQAFSRVMDAASRLERRKIPYGFMTTLLTANFDRLFELNDIICETSSSLWQIWLGNKCNDEPIWLTNSQIQKVLMQLPRLRSRTARLIIGDNIGYGKELESLRTPGFSEYSDKNFFVGCFGAKTVLGIKNDGSVKGCLFMPDSHLHTASNGNESLRERFKKAAFVHHQSVKEANAQCQGCVQYRQCGGGCPAWALSSGTKKENRFCYVPVSQSAVRAAAVSASLITLCAVSASGCSSAPSVQTMQPTVELAPAPMSETEINSDSGFDIANEQDSQEQNTGEIKKPDEIMTIKNPSASDLKPPASMNKGNTNRIMHPCMMSHVGCRDKVIVIETTKDTD